MNLNGQDHFHRKFVKKCGFHEADRRSLSHFASPPVQGAFHREVPAPSRSRATRRTRHRAPGFAASEPASDASFAPARLAPRRARPAAGSRAHHPGPGRPDAACRLLQSPRFLQHELRSDRPPRASSRELRPCSIDAGSPAPRGAGRSSCLQARGRRRRDALASSSPAMTRREALPRPDRLGHLLSRNRACPGRRSRKQVRGTRFPRVRRRPTRKGANRTRAAADAPPRRGA